jgi:hypothetical protein
LARGTSSNHADWRLWLIATARRFGSDPKAPWFELARGTSSNHADWRLWLIATARAKSHRVVPASHQPRNRRHEQHAWPQLLAPHNDRETLCRASLKPSRSTGSSTARSSTSCRRSFGPLCTSARSGRWLGTRVGRRFRRFGVGTRIRCSRDLRSLKLRGCTIRCRVARRFGCSRTELPLCLEPGSLGCAFGATECLPDFVGFCSDDARIDGAFVMHTLHGSCLQFLSRLNSGDAIEHEASWPGQVIDGTCRLRPTLGNAGFLVQSRGCLSPTDALLALAKRLLGSMFQRPEPTIPAAR